VDLTSLEKQRTELLQLLLLLIMVFLGIITFISFKQSEGYLIPSLGIVPLLACLYVIGKERSLKNLQVHLIATIIEKERQVKKIGDELKEEHGHLEEEKDKSLHLGLRLSELTNLYRAISTVNAVMDPKETLDSILRASLDLVGVNGGSIMLLDEKKEGLSLACSQGLGEEAIPQTQLKIGDGIAGWVAENRRALLLTEDLKEEESFRNLIINDEDIGSAMSVPLLVRTQIIGVINFSQSGSSPDKSKKLSESDLRLATIFSQHASVAIENMQLLSKIQKIKNIPAPNPAF